MVARFNLDQIWGTRKPAACEIKDGVISITSAPPMAPTAMKMVSILRKIFVTTEIMEMVGK
jgi:hypothetical protein